MDSASHEPLVPSLQTSLADIDDLPQIRIGTAEEFEKLRSALAGFDYNESTICQRLGLPSIYHFKGKAEGREKGNEVQDALDALIHLFMDGDTVPQSRVRELLPAETIRNMEALNLIATVGKEGEKYCATVNLYPMESLYIASDRTIGVKAMHDFVFPAATWNTRWFLGSLPESHCERLLDICCGTGIAALIGASRYADQAWACDLSERCIYFSEFNKKLNAVENVTCLQGDLFSPVAGMTFDRVVAHPPYVPAIEQKVLFRDGGEDGEQILQKIVERVSDHIAPGGRFYAFAMGTDREGETFEQRIRKWLGERSPEFDVILVADSVENRPEKLVKTVLESKGKLELGPRSQMLERLKVSATLMGAIVIQRVKSPRPVATTRVLKSRRAGNEAVDWFVRWTTASIEPGFNESLLEMRPKLARFLRLLVTHVVDNSTLVPANFEFRTDYPFAVNVVGPNWLAVSVGACDGSRTMLEIYEDMRRQEVIHPDMTPAQFAQNFTELIARGFIEVDEFRLPAPPAN